MSDPSAYRVNLICSCQNDIAYGYGATPLQARYIAESEFKKHHGTKAKYTQIIVEQAAADGSHYELYAAGLRYEFTRGLGIELYGREALADDLHRREHATHPYVFESNNPRIAAALQAALVEITGDGNVNRKVREAAQRANEFVGKLVRVLW